MAFLADGGEELAVGGEGDVVDIGGGADRADAAIDLLRRHPREGPEAATVARKLRQRVGGGVVLELAETEIAELHLPAVGGLPVRLGGHDAAAAAHGAGEEDVVRLDVAVDDAALVGHVEPLGEVLDDPGGDPRIDRARMAPEPLRQRAPGAELLGDEHHAVALADVVDRDEVGVREPRRQLGLADEAPAHAAGDECLRVGDLEGDVAAEERVERLVDRGEAPLPHGADDLEAIDACGPRRLLPAGLLAPGGADLVELQQQIELPGIDVGG